MARVVFMGTPEFAVPTLQALIDRQDVVGVVTQPDRRAGRGRKVTASAIKEVALAHGLTLLQPRTLRAPEAVANLAALAPDVIVVAAFGQILRPDVLSLSPCGCLNVHASLLPRWRGAAPIPAAILAGDEITGVTIMQMDAGLDTGPILAQAQARIRPDDTTESLTARLAALGAAQLADTLPHWLTGEIEPQPQDEAQATVCSTLRKSDGRIDWQATAEAIDRQVRAFHPWPGAFTFWEGRRLRVLRATPLPDWQGDAPPGGVLGVAGCLQVAAGAGAVRLEVVQPAGRKPMPGQAFARGQRGIEEGILGM
jgi:methionyl-tRNA formyltransferase